MNTRKPHMKLAGILLGLLVALPMSAVADKGRKADKEQKPNENSTTKTAACINDVGKAQVYSCKGLSNVVLWCVVDGSAAWVKHDDIVDENGNEVYQGEFGCVDADGNDLGGMITHVAVKSGSQKHVKHNDGYVVPEGFPDEPDDPPPPSGSGLFMKVDSCTALAAASIPVAGDCDAEPTVPPPPPPPLPGA